MPGPKCRSTITCLGWWPTARRHRTWSSPWATNGLVASTRRSRSLRQRSGGHPPPAAGGRRQPSAASQARLPMDWAATVAPFGSNLQPGESARPGYFAASWASRPAGVRDPGPRVANATSRRPSCRSRRRGRLVGEVDLAAAGDASGGAPAGAPGDPTRSEHGYLPFLQVIVAVIAWGLPPPSPWRAVPRPPSARSRPGPGG
jgi:hypothetical protein